MLMLRTGLWKNERSGFTFIEMVVVISIVLSISGLLTIWLGNFLASKELYMDAQKISAISNLAKEYSGARCVNFRVYFNLAENKFWIAGFNADGTYQIPATVKVYQLSRTVIIKSLNTPRSFYSDIDLGTAEDYVTFYPDGSSESAKLVLQSSRGEVYTVYYASTTGAIKVYPYEDTGL